MKEVFHAPMPKMGVKPPTRMGRTKPGSYAGVERLGKRAGTVELTHTNWRHKTKEDPRDVEYKMLMGGLSYANL